MAKTKIRFAGDGSGFTAVYSDIIPKLGLGDLQISRISDVDYDHSRRLWIAKRKDTGEVLCESISREHCVKEEVRILNSQLHSL
jgi:hypothetical protein